MMMTYRLCNHEHFTKGCRYCDPLSDCEAQLADEIKRRKAAEATLRKILMLATNTITDHGLHHYHECIRHIDLMANVVRTWQALVPADEKEPT